jgi:hypothetical protein
MLWAGSSLWEQRVWGPIYPFPGLLSSHLALVIKLPPQFPELCQEEGEDVRAGEFLLLF